MSNRIRGFIPKSVVTRWFIPKIAAIIAVTQQFTPKSATIITVTRWFIPKSAAIIALTRGFIPKSAAIIAVTRGYTPKGLKSRNESSEPANPHLTTPPRSPAAEAWRPKQVEADRRNSGLHRPSHHRHPQ